MDKIKETTLHSCPDKNCRANQPQEQVKPEWEEEFDKDYDRGVFDHFKEMTTLANREELKKFIRETLSAQAEEIVKMIGKMKKDYPIKTVADMFDGDRDIKFEAHNQALKEILTLIKEKYIK